MLYTTRIPAESQDPSQGGLAAKRKGQLNVNIDEKSTRYYFSIFKQYSL